MAQLVWVFDDDPSTKVVCEGYSKAFQYLCELSSFSGNIVVMLMTGDMFPADDVQTGPHMWNVVTMPNGYWECDACHHLFAEDKTTEIETPPLIGKKDPELHGSF